jgi:hypothetical protein
MTGQHLILELVSWENQWWRYQILLKTKLK